MTKGMTTNPKSETPKFEGNPKFEIWILVFGFGDSFEFRNSDSDFCSFAGGWSLEVGTFFNRFSQWPGVYREIRTYCLRGAGPRRSAWSGWGRDSSDRSSEIRAVAP